MTVNVTGVIGLILTIRLIINERISILENLAQSGVPIPEFLVKKLKIATESAGEKEEQNTDKGK